jgi:hypothetical protein
MASVGIPPSEYNSEESTMNVKGSINDAGLLTLVIDTKVKPIASKAETEKAVKAGREPEAKLVATTGGFTQFGNVKVSLNAMI